MQIDDNSGLAAMRVIADWRLGDREERLRVQPSVVTDLFGDCIELIDVSGLERGICKHTIRKRRWKIVCQAIVNLFDARLLPQLEDSQRLALCCWTARMTRKGVFDKNPLLETVRIHFVTFTLGGGGHRVKYHSDLTYDHLTILGEFAHAIDASTVCKDYETSQPVPMRRFRMVEHPDSARMDCQRYPRIPVHQWIQRNPEPKVVYLGLKGHVYCLPIPLPEIPAASPTSPRRHAVSPRPDRIHIPLRRNSMMRPIPVQDRERNEVELAGEFNEVLDLLLAE